MDLARRKSLHLAAGGGLLLLGAGCVSRAGQGSATAAATPALSATGSGAARLQHRHAGPGEQASTRLFSGLEPGTYTLRARAQAAGAGLSAHVRGRARGFTDARSGLLADGVARTVVLPAIPCIDGKED
jgi:hypothetical protein